MEERSLASARAHKISLYILQFVNRRVRRPTSGVCPGLIQQIYQGYTCPTSSRKPGGRSMKILSSLIEGYFS